MDYNGFCDGFYEDYSEFDRLIDEFKESLKIGVKEEFIKEITSLKDENKRLQEIKNKFDNIVNEYESKKHMLDVAINTAKSDVRRERLTELLADRQVVLYRVGCNYIKKEKCNLCDTNRQIHYISPQGRKVSEDCRCNSEGIIYKPQEIILYEFRKSDSSGELIMFYKAFSDKYFDEYFEKSVVSKDLYNPEIKYEEIDKYSIHFKDINDCQKYCDWLNNKGKNKKC
jgi:hypothetical protein